MVSSRLVMRCLRFKRRDQRSQNGGWNVDFNSFENLLVLAAVTGPHNVLVAKLDNQDDLN